MKSSSSVILSVVLVMLSLSAQADSPAGLSFTHNDWQLVCDNTRTCRAAGYQSYDEEMAVSVLLSREAGPRQPVTGEIMIGQYGENEALDELPPEFKLSMQIDDGAVGQVVMRKDSLVADLSAEQVAALLSSLTRDSNIEWVAGEHSWHLSDKGSSAVLLKMDEFQGRLGTLGALVRKGAAGEDEVLPPLAVPVTIAASLAEPLPDDDQFATENSQTLRGALRATVNDDDCSALTEERADEAELSIIRLTNTKLLVSTECWSAAYNRADGYWVIDSAPPFDPILVTASGSDYSDGSIFASHKGRGLGDCWSTDAWTWDGEAFVHTSSTSTGLCRLLAPGGAWSLPTLIMEIRQPPPVAPATPISSLDKYLDMLHTEKPDGGDLYCETPSVPHLASCSRGQVQTVG